MINTAHFHPMVVHFPVALILAGFLADLLFLFFRKQAWLSKTGFYLMVLGTLGAVAAYLTGQFFTAHPGEGAIVEIFSRHESLALVTLLIMCIATLVRIAVVIWKKDSAFFHWLVFGLYLLGTLSVSATGYLGGVMVMDYMMGL
jgi:uncharacterized membrane protein